MGGTFTHRNWEEPGPRLNPSSLSFPLSRPSENGMLMGKQVLVRLDRVGGLVLGVVVRSPSPLQMGPLGNQSPGFKWGRGRAGTEDSRNSQFLSGSQVLGCVPLPGQDGSC